MKIDKITLALVCLCAFCVTANLIYLKIDTTPPIWDPACHSLQGIKIFDIINSPALTFKNDLKADIVGCTRIYPPLVYLILYPFYKIFGTVTDVAVAAISIIFYPILIFSTYKIGGAVSGKKNIGLLAAFFSTMYPFVYSTSRQFLLDFPLIAVVSLSILLLIKTDDFKDQEYSIFLGMALGAGMLIKEAYLIFISMPLLLVFARAVRSSNRHAIVNCALTLAIGIGIATIWYLPSFGAIIAYSKDFVYGATSMVGEGDPLVYRFEGITYYIKNLIYSQTSFWHSLVFIFSLFFFYKRQDEKKNILLIWFFAPLLILTAIQSKDIRYSMPLLPAVALISSTGLCSIYNKKIRVSLIFIAVFYSILQFALHNTGRYYDRVPAAFPMSKAINGYLRGYMDYGWVAYPRRDDYTVIDRLFKVIFRDAKDKDMPGKIYLTVSGEIFNMYTLRYLAIKHGHDAHFDPLIFHESPLSELENAKDGSFIIQIYPYPDLFYYKNRLLMNHLMNNSRYSLLYSEDYDTTGKMYVYKAER